MRALLAVALLSAVLAADATVGWTEDEEDPDEVVQESDDRCDYDESSEIPIQLQCVRDRCGVRRQTVRKRILCNGDCIARHNQFPWIVSLATVSSGRSGTRTHVCGGTLISRQFILTSAHCFERNPEASIKRNQWEARLKKHDLDSESEVEMLVADVKTPSRDSPTGNNDIALVRLKCPLNLTNELNVACLPSRRMRLQPNRKCEIAGWGSTTADDPNGRSQHLRYTKVDLVDRDQCQQSYAEVIRTGEFQHVDFTPEIICAGNTNEEEQVDACGNDSGGPMMCESGQLTAIISAGHGCGEYGFPGLYTNVSHHLTWLYRTLKEEYQRCLRVPNWTPIPGCPACEVKGMHEN